MNALPSASPMRHPEDVGDARDQSTRDQRAERRSDRVSARTRRTSPDHTKVHHGASGGGTGSTAPASQGNPAKRRSKGWWRPLERGPQGGRFLELVRLEPDSLPAAMVLWLLRKRVRNDQYSARELAERFNISTNLAVQFLRRSSEGGWGWVEWCEGIVEAGSSTVETQHARSMSVARFPSAELVTTDVTREAC